MSTPIFLGIDGGGAESTPYALIGSVAQSDAIRDRLQTLLAVPTLHSYQMQEARLPPKQAQFCWRGDSLGNLWRPK